ncbi:MAG: porin family protein [Desulfobacterales bacterium]|nr:porin family protein [Desulfobacterales bacterium]
MIKELVIGILLVLVLQTSTLAAEKSSFYSGISYSYLCYSGKLGLDDSNPHGVIGTLGYHLNSNFSIEGFLGTGIKEDSIVRERVGLAAPGGDVIWLEEKLSDLELESMYGLFGVFSYALFHDFYLKCKLGLTEIDISASKVKNADPDSGSNNLNQNYSGTTDSSMFLPLSYKETCISYGLGLDYLMAEKYRFGLNYTVYGNKSGNKLSALDLGFGVLF